MEPEYPRYTLAQCCYTYGHAEYKHLRKSQIYTSVTLKSYNVCCCMVQNVGQITKVDALDQWCLWRLLGIKWYQFVSTVEVLRKSGQCLLWHPSNSSWITKIAALHLNQY